MRDFNPKFRDKLKIFKIKDAFKAAGRRSKQVGPMEHLVAGVVKLAGGRESLRSDMNISDIFMTRKAIDKLTEQTKTWANRTLNLSGRSLDFNVGLYSLNNCPGTVEDYFDATKFDMEYYWGLMNDTFGVPNCKKEFMTEDRIKEFIWVNLQRARIATLELADDEIAVDVDKVFSFVMPDVSKDKKDNENSA